MHSITLPEAARRLGVRYFRLWDLVTSGEVPTSRSSPAGRFSIAVADLPLAARLLGVPEPQPLPPAEDETDRAAAA